MYEEKSNHSLFQLVPAPNSWAASEAPLSSLHQLSPYIGKLKPEIARYLISRYTKIGDLIVDPFCGSGSIPLEASLAGRSVFASDISPYAFLITKAKLSAPSSETRALFDFAKTINRARNRKPVELSHVPAWVRQFFHPKTLSEAIGFADECIERRNYFLLACLLGILHHQRPGFLSYPSSHLVPYLRDKKYSRDEYPEMYNYRDLAPRLEAKISRAYKVSTPRQGAKVVVRKADIKNVTTPCRAQALITSPPYMNALDYRRDNRLRLWFLDRTTANYSPEPTDRRAGIASMVEHLVRQAENSLIRNGKLILIIGETVVRKRLHSHPSAVYAGALRDSGKFALVDAFTDSIPDIRRSRRDCGGTKTEHILVYEKKI